MRQKFARFMYGRYGSDNFSRFLSLIAIIILIVAMFLSDIARSILFAIALALVIYEYFRFFSRNISERSKENAKYLSIKQRIKAWYNMRRDMWRQRKEYKFFRCPSCKAVLRVPRGKGRIRIVCTKCGTAFEKKT